LHDLTKQRESIMFDIFCIEYSFNQSILSKCFAAFSKFDCIPLDDPKYWSQDFMHALAIAQIWIQLTEDEQYVQEHSLRVRLPKVQILRHAADNIL
jgi:hypothetical protein